MDWNVALIIYDVDKHRVFVGHRKDGRPIRMIDYIIYKYVSRKSWVPPPPLGSNVHGDIYYMDVMHVM